MKMTSACANKMLRKLNEEKSFYLNLENDGCTYIASLDEEPVIPSYDYEETAQKIEAIDRKIVKIKHAINLSNVMNTIMVNGEPMTADTILVSMAQLNRRRSQLDRMRRKEPKTRINSGPYAAKKSIPEYEYLNYDPGRIKTEYDRVDGLVTAMQLALDHYNQTVEFEVEID